jgi:hypothetical protein
MQQGSQRIFAGVARKRASGGEVFALRSLQIVDARV